MPTDPPSGNKPRLRRQMRARRSSLSPAAARAAAFSAVHRLWSLPCLARARRLALYLPADGELDCTPLAVQAWRRGRQVFLPVITGETLRFAPFHSRSEMRATG